jgi:hypothetical protein
LPGVGLGGGCLCSTAIFFSLGVYEKCGYVNEV